MRLIFYFLIIIALLISSCANKEIPKVVPQEVMEMVYEEVKTPYKYGLVLSPPNDNLKYDCPTIFRYEDCWYMTYVVYDGSGYETWLAQSNDLLKWNIEGRILSFNPDSLAWDRHQAAGYNALQNLDWEGPYTLEKWDDKYWMSYFGSNTMGYEKGLLSIGMAYTSKTPAEVHEWTRLKEPVLSPHDSDVRWWENSVMYKSSVIRDEKKLSPYPFLIYYNARGDSINPGRGAERIGIAGSHDMVNWERFLDNPVLNHHKGITGDALIKRMGDLYVMFYFGAFWTEEDGDKAWNRFACSYDLINWTDWNGPHLIEPSENYDSRFAHKSFVIKHDGVVYHFYNAVNDLNQRGIALASSKYIGKSDIEFVPSKGRSY